MGLNSSEAYQTSKEKKYPDAIEYPPEKIYAAAKKYPAAKEYPESKWANYPVEKSDSTGDGDEHTDLNVYPEQNQDIYNEQKDINEVQENIHELKENIHEEQENKIHIILINRLEEESNGYDQLIRVKFIRENVFAVQDIFTNNISYYVNSEGEDILNISSIQEKILNIKDNKFFTKLMNDSCIYLDFKNGERELYEIDGIDDYGKFTLDDIPLDIFSEEYYKAWEKLSSSFDKLNLGIKPEFNKMHYKKRNYDFFKSLDIKRKGLSEKLSENGIKNLPINDIEIREAYKNKIISESELRLIFELLYEKIEEKINYIDLCL